MKILRLDLLAFGPFSGESLPLHMGEHGFHLVYGPNEAGKSTSLRAIRQFLYGIPTYSHLPRPVPACSLSVTGLRPRSTDCSLSGRMAAQPLVRLGFTGATQEPQLGTGKPITVRCGSTEQQHVSPRRPSPRMRGSHPTLSQSGRSPCSAQFQAVPCTRS